MKTDAEQQTDTCTLTLADGQLKWHKIRQPKHIPISIYVKKPTESDVSEYISNRIKFSGAKLVENDNANVTGSIPRECTYG